VPGFFAPGHLGVMPAPVSHAPGPAAPGLLAITSAAWWPVPGLSETWPGVPGPCCARAWPPYREPWAVVPGPWSLGRELQAVAVAARVPGPGAGGESRRAFWRTTRTANRAARFAARAKCAKALARFRTNNYHLNSFRPLFGVLLFHVKLSCQKYPFLCKMHLAKNFLQFKTKQTCICIQTRLQTLKNSERNLSCECSSLTRKSVLARNSSTS